MNGEIPLSTAQPISYRVCRDDQLVDVIYVDQQKALTPWVSCLDPRVFVKTSGLWMTNPE